MMDPAKMIDDVLPMIAALRQTTSNNREILRTLVRASLEGGPGVAGPCAIATFLFWIDMLDSTKGCDVEGVFAEWMRRKRADAQQKAGATEVPPTM